MKNNYYKLQYNSGNVKQDIVFNLDYLVYIRQACETTSVIKIRDADYYIDNSVANDLISYLLEAE